MENHGNVLQNKIDFLMYYTVTGANPNGGPDIMNLPRLDYEGHGEVSDVCLKRKMRNRIQDFGNEIFVQSDGRETDEFRCLARRADEVIKKDMSVDEVQKEACKKWFDVRAFGQVFAFKAAKSTKSKVSKKDKAQEFDADAENAGVSIFVRGPVSVHPSKSIDPVVIRTMQITKSVNGDEPGKSGKSSDRMGSKSFVDFGLYVVKGAINVQLAEKTGFTEEDAETIKKALTTLFENDVSAARPEGSMEVCKVYWFKHNNKYGQCSTAKVHRSVKAVKKVERPTCFEDYELVYTPPVEGLDCEIIDCR